jgi:predicted enzyme related to lactoylglutathione lyase
MGNHILGLSIDAADAAALAGFWAEALGREVAADAGEAYAVVVVDAATTSVPRLVFHQVPEGKAGKNRLHLDLLATDWEAEIGRLTSLGATRIRDDVEVNGVHWTTLADPEGNEFDLVRD